MSDIITTVNLWLGVTKDNQVLCYGNMNKHLSYHLSSYWWRPFDNAIVNGMRRFEIMDDIKKWNRECGNKKQFKCKAVKVAITVEAIKKGKIK